MDSVRIVLPLMAALLLGGCDYFRPAEPEPPSTTTSFLPDYTDPDSTLSTIAKALADKGRTIGGTAYADAFSDSPPTALDAYHHIFWPQDVADWNRVPPEDWGITLEKTFYERFVLLFPNAYHLEWEPDVLNPDNVGANSATIHRHYELTGLAAGGTPARSIAIGFADLTLLRFSDGRWRIVRWEDRRDPKADPNDVDQKTLGRRRLNTI